MLNIRVLGRRAAPLSVLLGLLAGQATGAEVVKWWTAPDIQSRLQLTPRQVAELNRIFDETLSERLASRERLVTLEAALARLMARPDASEAETLKLVERVEALRARRNVSRTMMLLRMSRVLTLSQRAALDAAADRPQPPVRPGPPARANAKPQK
jgi:Spy/CpxP family protein refolding chaperone